MFLCEIVSMRTTLDLPDPLFKRLKTCAAQEGRTLRDLVLELVEKRLSARALGLAPGKTQFSTGFMRNLCKFKFQL
jgi:predicted DNA-binding ribbon-helix-helix protein